MFLLLLIQILLSIGWTCSIKNTYQSILYPTEQEIYKLDLSELFNGEDLLYICTVGDDNSIKERNIQRCNQKDYGIDIQNILTEENYSMQNFDKITKQITSISGFYNYISTIQNNSILTTYEVNYTNNTITQLITSNIQVNIDCQSYSSAFTSQTNIITDCFNNNYFQLLLFIQDASPIIIYEFNQNIYDISLIAYTDLTYINNYIIYAIYLQNYESYLFTYYYNQTNQSAKQVSKFEYWTFTDYQIMIDGKSIAILNITNCIFISQIDNLNIYTQINIPNNPNNRQLLALKLLPSFLYGQLITTFIIVSNNDYDNIVQFQLHGSNLTLQSIYESFQSFKFNRYFPINILLSTSFLVVTQNGSQTYFYISKYSNSHEYQIISQIYHNKDFQYDTQLYLNYETNKLLKFSRKLSWHHLSKPQLIINITSQSLSGQLNIFAYENPEVHEDDIFGCNLTLLYQQLNQDNYTILNTTNISTLSTIQDLSETFCLNDHFTGPFMQINLVEITNNSNFSISISQSEVFQYLQTNLPGLWQNMTQLYFIEKSELLFYAWTELNNFTNIFFTICGIGKEILICTTTQSITCDVNLVTTIQMSQLNSTELVLVFNQGLQIILVYQIFFDPTIDLKNKQFEINIISYNLLQNYTSINSIIQFQILYNKLIVLNNQSEIIVYFYKLNKSFSINQMTINEVGGQQYDIQFSPIQIQVNQQLYQSNLFINNQNGFIILEILSISTSENQNFRILSWKQLNQDISQIVIIQMYIVLASINSSNIVSFSVYDISVITQPEFLKPLPDCTIQNDFQIIADNYFFYVRQINNFVYVYSIDLPYHSSLYFNLSLNQNDSLSCTNTNKLSILSLKNNLYAGFQNNPYSFSIQQVKQQDNMITPFSLIINIQNFWDSITITYKLLVVNIYLQISMNINQYNSNNNSKALTFYAKKNSNNQILIPLNMTNVSMGQVLNYSLLASKNGINQSNLAFNITNQFINKEQYFTKSIANISQMTSFCSSLFYQNTTGLYQSSYVIFDGLQVLNYSSYNFTECLSLSVSINGPSIYMNSICKSDQQITVFSLFPNASKSNNSTNYTCTPSQPWNQSNQIYQIDQVPYNSIIKSSQLTHYLFILGKVSQNKNSQSIYIYSLDDTDNNTLKNIRRIQCRGGISDYNFTILQNKSLINSTYSGRGVIFYLCQNPSELKYLSFNITNTTNLTFSKLSIRVSDVITQYYNRSNANFLQIFIYLVKYDQIVLVLTSNQVYNLIIIMSYSPLSYAQTSLQFEDVIAYIPPYGAYNQIPLGVLQDSYLVLLFRQPITSEGAQYIVAIYNIAKIKQTYNISSQFNYNSTIQMEGGYQFDSNFAKIYQIALINQTNNNGGYFLIVMSNDGKSLNRTQVSLLVFNQTIYFNCSDVKDLDHNYEYQLMASNSFYYYLMTIKITPEELNNAYWAWILLILTIIICATLVYQFWKKIKMQNLENKSTELLEIEM